MNEGQMIMMGRGEEPDYKREKNIKERRNGKMGETDKERKGETDN